MRVLSSGEERDAPASHRSGSSCCGAQAVGSGAQWLWFMGSRVLAQSLWHTSFGAPQQVESSQTRD